MAKPYLFKEKEIVEVSGVRFAGKPVRDRRRS
jgi:hypothetical protein